MTVYGGGKSGEDFGKTVSPEQEGGTIIVHIYDLAFFLCGDISAEKLWHVVGHEMTHAGHMVKGGLWWTWLELFEDDPWKALCASEMLAFQWNITSFSEVQYDGGLDFFFCEWQIYYDIFPGDEMPDEIPECSECE